MQCLAHFVIFQLFDYFVFHDGVGEESSKFEQNFARLGFRFDICLLVPTSPDSVGV